LIYNQHPIFRKTQKIQITINQVKKMSIFGSSHALKRGYKPALALSLFIFFAAIMPVLAQDGDLAALRAQAEKLVAASKYVEAAPILEKILAIDPQNSWAWSKLGMAYLGKAVLSANPEEKKSLRIKARAAFGKAFEIDKTDSHSKALFSAIPEDGAVSEEFSKDPVSNALTQAGEKAFAQGNISEALKLYQDAFQKDQKNYYAALFAGDMYYRLNDFPNAEIWFQKAIAVDPNIETAWRYSASPLMKQGEYLKARDRYIEAWITNPYSSLTTNAFIQWGKITNTRLGHPKITPPKIESDPKSQNSKVTINITDANDGSIGWISYVATRETWQKELFSKNFPNEKNYRHSLMEEADALRSVVRIAKSTKPKQLERQIALIEELDSQGLLEAYILLALADNGIAQDHAQYLRTNRDKLRQYVLKYVIQQGSN
jgi:tetratricopeptide (TPR) repeat protein